MAALALAFATYWCDATGFKDRSVVLMFWPTKGQTSGRKNPFSANSTEKLKVELKEAFPNIAVFPSDTVLQEFLDERPEKETFMKLNKHASPDRRVALLGDAAVEMYNKLVQGVTSVMQRANVLAEAVDNDQMIGFSEALRSFSDESVLEGHAITDSNLLDHAMAVPLIGRCVPNPTQMSSLHDPDVPYRDIRKEYQGWIRLPRYSPVVLCSGAHVRLMLFLALAMTRI